MYFNESLTIEVDIDAPSQNREKLYWYQTILKTWELIKYPFLEAIQDFVQNMIKLDPKQHQSVIFTKICNIHLCYIKVAKHISNTTYIRTDFFRGIFKTT